jgi:hypothetical protein
MVLVLHVEKLRKKVRCVVQQLRRGRVQPQLLTTLLEPPTYAASYGTCADVAHALKSAKAKV